MIPADDVLEMIWRLCMNTLKLLVIVAVAGICCMVAAPRIEAQVSINIGPEPVCPYGYYDYAPYTCAPYGY
jgi:hypothetical protein